MNNMDRKEEQVQKALGTFDDYLKCIRCGRVTHKSKIKKVPTISTMHLPGAGGKAIKKFTGPFTPQCECGGEVFE
jgi:hypothetical protein